jgi:hypothetical protein
MSFSSSLLNAGAAQSFVEPVDFESTKRQIIQEAYERLEHINNCSSPLSAKINCRFCKQESERAEAEKRNAALAAAHAREASRLATAQLARTRAVDLQAPVAQKQEEKKDD